MLRLLMLLGAGGYLYSLGHNSAVASSSVEAPPQASALSSVASAGAGWIAREVHEQTAWAAEPEQAAPALAAEVAEAPAPVAVQPLAAAFAPPPPVAVAPAPAARRGLQVVIEPEITIASR